MEEYKDIFYCIGIALTFIAAIGNIVYSVIINKRTTFINSVTSQRMKWISEFRGNISKFCGLTHSFCRSKFTEDERKEILKEIDVIRYFIRLQLNPKYADEQRIEIPIKQIPDLASESYNDKLFKSINELIETSQSILNKEWAKVKTESIKGKSKNHIP